MSAERPAAPIPDRPSPRKLRDALGRCRACDLWEGATQGVMGEGARGARLMLIGEQPGDHEDQEGRPFVGPAGQILDRGLERAEIPRAEVYVTNAVKHFRYQQRGKRRIHQKPDRWQVNACLPWLRAEFGMVKPEAVVLLGATAAHALASSKVRVGRDRGKPIESDLAELVIVTTHPSAILRAPGDRERHGAMEAFIEDLCGVAAWLKESATSRA